MVDGVEGSGQVKQAERGNVPVVGSEQKVIIDLQAVNSKSVNYPCKPYFAHTPDVKTTSPKKNLTADSRFL